jgi:protoheme IX farnesyltransferase
MKIKFRRLVLAGTLMTYLVILFGVFSRVTESAGCPDWPTCYGSWMIPFQTTSIIDYFHRVATLLAGILVIISILWAWRSYRKDRYLIIPLSLSVLFLGAEIIVGALGVYGFLSQIVEKTLHLGFALLIFGSQVFAVTAAYRTKNQDRFAFKSPFGKLSLITTLIVFFLFLSGSIVSVTGASNVCRGWPLCDPQGILGWINLIHRAIVLIAGLLIMFLGMRAWQTQRSKPAILVSSTAAVVMFVAQALMGAIELSQNFPQHLIVLHMASSIGVFATIIITSTLTGFADRTANSENLELFAWRSRSKKRLAVDLLMLTKPIVVVLLLVTTFAGMVIGAQEWPAVSLAFWTLLGGFMAAGGSGAINQYIDRKDDVQMQRTQQRPIPAGRLTPAEGLAFGVGLSLGSFYIMMAFVNMLAALLTLAGIVYYVLLYSIFLKKTTVQNIVIGGGAGAIPPLVGWAAATGSLNVPSLFLFAIVFMWTPPHFWALAIVRRKDYARAGVPMLPVVRGELETRKQIFVYTIELVALTLVIPLFGLGGGVYFILAVILGLWLLSAAWRVWKIEGNKVAWKMYRYSSMYLAFIFAALVIDSLM